jgi:hypothetical protein
MGQTCSTHPDQKVTVALAAVARGKQALASLVRGLDEEAVNGDFVME